MDPDRIYVVQEPDAGGDSFVAGLVRRLEELGWQGNAHVVHLPAGIKDPNDLHKRDPNGFLEIFQDCLGKAERLEIQKRTTSQSWQAPIPLGEFDLQAFPTEALPAWQKGCGSAFIRAEGRGGSVRYNVRDAEKYLAARRVSHEQVASEGIS